jgi:hypothetical protein
MAVIGWASTIFNQMDKEIQKIVDAIKINVEIAKVDGKPLIAEVSMNDKSKEYIANLILEYGNTRYLQDLEYGAGCP